MNRLSVFLARVMLAGTVVAAVIIAAGLVWYLSVHVGVEPGDHLFTSEPICFRDPVAMFRSALDPDSVARRRSLVMIGIFLLLLNPPVRIVLAAVGFLLEKDRLYALISAIVFLILAVSFFW